MIRPEFARAVILRPRMIISLARVNPARCATRTVPPLPGVTPRLISGKASMLFSVARRKSQASDNSNETPIAHVSIAAMTGFFARSGAATLQCRSCMPSRSTFRKPAISPPELYNPFAPRITITRTSGSLSIAWMIAAICERPLKLIVFMGGRSKMIAGFLAVVLFPAQAVEILRVIGHSSFSVEVCFLSRLLRFCAVAEIASTMPV